MAGSPVPDPFVGIFQAVGMGTIAHQCWTRGETAQIAQTFQHAVNLWTESGHLLTVTSRPTQAPNHMNLASATALSLAPHFPPGAEAEFGPQALVVAGRPLVRPPPTIYQSLLHHRPGAPVTGSHILQAASLLSILPTEGSVLDRQRPAFPQLRAWVHGVCNAGLIAGWRYGVEHAADIAGLGLGFTPSGDDVLAGFVATAFIAAPRRGVRVPDLPPRLPTTRVSERLVRYAAEGFVPDPLARFIIALLFDGIAAGATLFDVIPLGHTSGIDLAVGALLGAACAGRNEEVLERLAATLGFIPALVPATNEESKR